jgi:hypothetical protein
MNDYNPASDVIDGEKILDHGAWPNFHDAEVHHLNIWRGDVRPDDNVWIGPVIEASFELCALKDPYLAVLKFHDCSDIRLTEFNPQKAIYDLKFEYVARGHRPNGEPLTPFISVHFEQAFGMALSFKCFKVQALERKNVEPSSD